jgi:hypothetical protein
MNRYKLTFNRTQEIEQEATCEVSANSIEDAWAMGDEIPECELRWTICKEENYDFLLEDVDLLEGEEPSDEEKLAARNQLVQEIQRLQKKLDKMSPPPTSVFTF